MATALYISFFPQLVAGPIVKAYGFLPQIQTKFFRDIRWQLACEQVIMGFFLKSVIADNIKDHTIWIAYPYFEASDSITLLVMLFGYSMQIFADFAGYSLIALGLAELFCYQLPENFNFPYISRTFQEFWTRWHISLSSWLREYLYFSLGGNKKGVVRTYFNLMAVMFLGGLWHGAAWSYAVWGSFHGLALVVERLLGSRIKLPNNRFFSALQMGVVFAFVTLAWLLFKLPNFDHAVKYIQAIGRNGGTRNFNVIFYILLYSLPVVAYHLLYLARPYTQQRGTFTRLQPITYAVMLFFILVNSGAAGEFIYFQF